MSDVNVSCAVIGVEVTAAANAGDLTIALDNRLGLAERHVLRIGTAPDEEFVTVAAIVGARNPKPVDGIIGAMEFPLTPEEVAQIEAGN